MKIKSLISAVLLAVTALSAAAQGPAIEVENAWVRFTVPGQKATGAFMTLSAKDGAKLVGVSSPAAGVAQVHEMKMEAGVMTMGAVKGGLDLPAGQSVELKSGGHHVMLMDLKSTLAKGASLPLTLVFRDAKGVESKLEINVPVAASAPGAKDQGNEAKMDHSAHDKAAPAAHQHGDALAKPAQ